MRQLINLVEIRAERRAASIASTVLADLAVIQDRLIGYFHVDAGNPATDVEMGAAGLLCALAEQLALAARSLQGRGQRINGRHSSQDRVPEFSVSRKRAREGERQSAVEMPMCESPAQPVMAFPEFPERLHRGGK